MYDSAAIAPMEPGGGRGAGMPPGKDRGKDGRRLAGRHRRRLAARTHTRTRIRWKYTCVRGALLPTSLSRFVIV